MGEGEVPPFGVEREEPMTQHSIAQDETVRLLLGSDSLVVGVREFAEIVDKQIFKILSKYKKVRTDRDAPWEDVTKLKYIEELTKILDV